MTAWRIILLLLGVARLTRLVTEDDLGWWWIRQPAYRWANHREMRLPPLSPEERVAVYDGEPEPENGWRSKLVSGLGCRWCVGFHLGWLALAAELLTSRKGLRWARGPWSFLLGALALNAASNAVGKGTGTLP